VREFLITELELAQELSIGRHMNKENKGDYIHIPIHKRKEKEKEGKETELDFQTFKVVKKLDNGSEDKDGIGGSEKDNEKYMTPQRKAEKQIKRYNPDFSGGFF
jgi:hypothetical protein